MLLMKTVTVKFGFVAESAAESTFAVSVAVAPKTQIALCVMYTLLAA